MLLLRIPQSDENLETKIKSLFSGKEITEEVHKNTDYACSDDVPNPILLRALIEQNIAHTSLEHLLPHITRKGVDFIETHPNKSYFALGFGAIIPLTSAITAIGTHAHPMVYSGLIGATLMLIASAGYVLTHTYNGFTPNTRSNIFPALKEHLNNKLFDNIYLNREQHIKNISKRIRKIEMKYTSQAGSFEQANANVELHKSIQLTTPETLISTRDMMSKSTVRKEYAWNKLIQTKVKLLPLYTLLRALTVGAEWSKNGHVFKYASNNPQMIKETIAKLDNLLKTQCPQVTQSNTSINECVDPIIRNQELA